MLALRRNKSKPKKVYKDSSALQANYMKERELLKIEANRRKFEERKNRSDAPHKIEKTKEQIAIEHQLAFVKSIKDGLYKQKKKNFKYLAYLDRRQMVKLWKYIPRSKLSKDFIPKDFMQERYDGVQSLRGYTHLTRGPWRTPITSRGRGQGKQHFIFGEFKYLKNVKERFWSLLSRNKDVSISDTFETCKDFMNNVLLGTHPEINYISKFNNFLYWILTSSFFMVVMREFISVINDLQLFIQKIMNNNSIFYLKGSDLVINSFYCSISKKLDFNNIIEYKKKLYISHIVLKLIYSLNINLLACLNINITKIFPLSKQYSNFILKMNTWNNATNMIPGHFFATSFLSSNINTQYTPFLKHKSLFDTFVWKPNIIFMFNYSGFFTKELIDPLNIPNITRFFFNFFSFRSMSSWMNRLFNSVFQLNSKKVFGTEWVHSLISSGKFKYCKYFKINYYSSYLIPRIRQISHYFNNLFFNYYFIKFSGLSLDTSELVTLYLPIVNDNVRLSLFSKSNVLKDFFAFIKKKAYKFLWKLEDRLMVFKNVITDLNINLTSVLFNDLRFITLDIITWIKNQYIILYNKYLVGKDIFFPFILPSIFQIQRSNLPSKSIYSGTTRKISGRYTTSIREMYKTENVLAVRELVKAITTGGGRARSVSIVYKMLKHFKSMHDNYDISAILALERCVNYCSPRLRVKKFIKGTSKIYKFMPMRFSRRIGSGIHNYVGASFLRTTFRTTHKKFYLTLAEELASIFIGVMRDVWTPQERFSLEYSCGVKMDVLGEDMIPPAYDIVRENRQMLTFLRYYPTRVRGQVLISSPYLEFVNRKKEIIEDELVE